MAKPQMCLNGCNKPAVPSKNTVPLCADCQALASGKSRGVTVRGKDRTRVKGACRS